MDELDEILSLALDRYFTIVTNVGTINNVDLLKLVSLSALQHILENYQIFITDDDLRYIIRAFYCLGNDCLIQFPEFPCEDDLYRSFKMYPIRISEDEVSRISEDDSVRVKA